jgi:hypothetical protein
METAIFPMGKIAVSLLTRNKLGIFFDRQIVNAAKLGRFSQPLQLLPNRRDESPKSTQPSKFDHDLAQPNHAVLHPTSIKTRINIEKP